MTTSAFTQLIAINPPTATTVEVNHHLDELQQVAPDLRNERTLSRSKRAEPNPFRLAIGSALVSLGSAVAGPRARRVELRAR
jgi:hypothetical protein